MQKTNLQWHPAFFAGLQIELSEESSNLIFENEHLLGTKPTQIDILIIKKNKNIPIQKNIGQLFRKYNIVEYKSPSDYLSIDDFYKVYAYACFYKSHPGLQNHIDISEITITFVSKKYPFKLMRHLETVRKYKVSEIYSGIYYIKGDFLPIQFIVTGKLKGQENIWLYSLTDELIHEQDAARLVSEYRKHQNQYLYESVMEVIVCANMEKFMEGNHMCPALEEMIQEIIQKRGKKQLEESERRGEQYFISLTQKLLSDSRLEDLKEATVNGDFRQKLYAEYGINAEALGMESEIKMDFFKGYDGL